MKLNKRQKTSLGCFALMALGTSPTLFSNPLEYLVGLVFCLFTSLAIARILI